MRYLPHTPEEIAAMLNKIGAEDLDSLFSAVPEECCCKGPMNLPQPLTEWELNRHMQTLSSTMGAGPECKVFMGAGSYEHFIPYALSHLVSRSEFLTSYTPYQPEISQGTLQGIYEYQTLTARLLGMEVANASLYDGASALAEALLMAVRITKSKRVAVSRLIHPHYRRVVQTYFGPTGHEIIELPYLPDGRTDLSSVEALKDTAAVAVQSPNFLGCVEDLQALAEKTHGTKALFVTAFSEPLAYGLYRNPGSLGADIACGEGQSLGIPQSFGGPGLGMFATKMGHVRNMPGRVAGKTVDLEGRRGFVLTLATREQHIRREKATSNICTNHSLCALSAAMYMALLGKTGIRELARLNHDKAQYLKGKLQGIGFKIAFPSPTFNEFVVEVPDDFEKTYQELLRKGIIAGLPLSLFYPELPRHYLMCVTETKTKEDMDKLVMEVQS
jgi:glycine dehydrogenase subunit 1